MNFLTGLQNFLNIINDNWTTILVCAGLIVGIVKKTQDYLSKSDDEKIKKDQGVDPKKAVDTKVYSDQRGYH